MHKKLKSLWKSLAGLAFSLALALPSYGAYDKFQKEFALLQTQTSLSFVWASDLHYCSKRLYNFGITPNGVRVLGEETQKSGADFLALTGDLLHGKDVPKNLLKEYGEINSVLSKYSIRVLRLIGNHDNGSYYANLKKNADVLNYSQLMDSTWYYEDFPKSKIRVICLNSSDVPVIPQDNGLKHYTINHYAYGREQLLWLTESLRLPKDWACIILTHIDPYKRTNEGFAALNKILKCCKKGTHFKDTALDIDADFSLYPSHELIALFAGHIHRDLTRTVNGIPHIITCRAVTARPEFKGVTIDRPQRRIYLTDPKGITSIINF